MEACGRAVLPAGPGHCGAHRDVSAPGGDGAGARRGGCAVRVAQGVPAPLRRQHNAHRQGRSARPCGASPRWCRSSSASCVQIAQTPRTATRCWGSSVTTSSRQPSSTGRSARTARRQPSRRSAPSSRGVRARALVPLRYLAGLYSAVRACLASPYHSPVLIATLQSTEALFTAGFAGGASACWCRTTCAPSRAS